jgi:hypothetical protein
MHSQKDLKSNLASIASDIWDDGGIYNIGVPAQKINLLHSQFDSDHSTIAAEKLSIFAWRSTRKRLSLEINSLDSCF